jgi:fermentation-respiration switch protein FrsA (DUF1100 family)
MRKAATIFVLVLAALLLPTVAAGVAAASGRHSAHGRSTPRTKSSRSPSPKSTSSPLVAPSASGPPFAVGVTHVTYTDTSRSTEAQGDSPATSSRTISVTIRYPVPGVSGAAEAKDATAAAGVYPLVVFAHGFDVSAATYAAMENQLAAAGFVVAAPDFPLTSSALGEAVDESDVSNQAADVSFVITEMLDAATVPAVLAGSVSSGPVGVVGHSDGGVTAAAVAYNSTAADPRIGAAVVLSGAEARYDGTWFTTQSPPLLAIHGTADEVNPLESSEQLYDDAAGSKMLVTVDGGSHLGPFTTDPVEPTVGRLVGDFLRAHLDDDPSASGRLGSDANVAGDLTLIAAT